ncbi:SDR family NAD(P)-dependent oxidoreductase [Stappia stellulata]|uniref:SDR family NAD(P)-dependent oxidoreductase n=1 Tax=Stappia stellulata TaxID=71235 RepID=UPI00040BACEE|nr:SDR family oxidoreductase [Stappia stellulata]
MSTPLPNPPSFRLEGKRALVTGASRGIGLAAAAALADAGASVVLAARSRADLTAGAEAIRKAGGTAEILPLDVADLPSALEAINGAGAFDILFNNAGINRPGPFLDATPADFDTVFSVNVRAAYFIAQAVSRGMVAQGRGGSIIQTSSQMGHVGGIDRTIYTASKHALEGLTRAMAIELGKHNVRVNTVCPTFVATALTASTMQDPVRMDWIRSKIHLGRTGEVTDITGAVVFLASDAAALITGSSVMIDGGWTAG